MFGIKSVEGKHVVYDKATGNHIQKFNKKGHALSHIKKLKGGFIGYSDLNSVIDETYNQTPAENINGYQIDPTISNDYGKVYHNKNTNHTIISHRGTSGASDWLNNGAYALGQYEKTNRYKTGKAIQDQAELKYGSQNTSTVGHSQGAILARKLGAKSKEIINVNPAYLGERPLQNEYTVRSSGDLVSRLYQPVALARRILYPNYSKKRDITIKSNRYFNPVNKILKEHSADILKRVRGSVGRGV
jgi:hypothetical protein